MCHLLLPPRSNQEFTPPKNMSGSGQHQGPFRNLLSILKLCRKKNIEVQCAGPTSANIQHRWVEGVTESTIRPIINLGHYEQILCIVPLISDTSKYKKHPCLRNTFQTLTEEILHLVEISKPYETCDVLHINWWSLNIWNQQFHCFTKEPHPTSIVSEYLTSDQTSDKTTCLFAQQSTN